MAQIDGGNEEKDQSFKILPEACLKPPAECEQMWTNERERGRWEEEEGVKTYNTSRGGGVCESLEDAVEGGREQNWVRRAEGENRARCSGF